MKVAAIETINLDEYPNVLWVQVHTDAGIVGLGETFYAVEPVIGHIHQTIAPYLLGQNPLQIDKHSRHMLYNYLGFKTVGAEMRGASAVDIALWDILGQVPGQPIHQLLGGASRDTVRAYNTCAGYQYVRAKSEQGTANFGMPGDSGKYQPYEDLVGFMKYADELALSLLSEALRDPDVKVRAVKRYSPEPNPVQRMDFVRAYLDVDRPADAMAWLQEPWGPHEGSRQGLLAEALERLGRFDESLPLRQTIFENSLAVFDLHRWLEHLPEGARSAARARARNLALNHDDPVRAAALLLELEEDGDAEAVLLAEPASIDGDDYGSLVPLAKTLRERELRRAETAVYRALLTGILDRAYARAYGHAARYWKRLREIADMGADLQPLLPHSDFEASIRTRHARKASFWAHVKGQHQDDNDAV